MIIKSENSIRHAGEYQHPVINYFDWIPVATDFLGSGVLRRSTSCIHAVVSSRDISHILWVAYSSMTKNRKQTLIQHLIKTIFILFTFHISLFSSAFAAEKPNPLDHFLNKLESFQADFVQTLSNEQGVTLETSSGVVYMQNPSKFRWVYQEPYEQLIITDGKTLWLYDEDLAQVTIRDIEESINNTPAAIISGQENIDKYYVTVDMGEIEGYNWIELTPKDTENQYSSVRLGFDDNNLGMMIMFDNLGQVTRIDFNNPLRNKRFGGPLFTFVAPEGVDVVDDRVQAENITPVE